MPGHPDPHGAADTRDHDAHGQTRDGADDPRALTREATAGISQLEGYLLAHQARIEAEKAGTDFARRFAWLGPQEESAVARAFAQEHLAIRRQMFRAAVARADELRDQYSHRYECLRRRLVATVLGLSTGAAVALAVLVRING